MPRRTQHPIKLEPIGYVHNAVPEPIHEGWDEIVSEIVVQPQLALALDGLDDFSHLIVLFWIDGVAPSRRHVLKIHPRDREDLPLLGIFATRTQYRPNPIGVTVVALLARRANVVVVQGLDAIDGTPVLDLKPYFTRRDSIPDARMPDWTERMRRR